MITGRDSEIGKAAEEELGDRQRARFVAADVNDERAVDASVEQTLESMGRLDVLVNNAGIAITERLLDTPTGEFDRLMATNVRGCFLYARATFEALSASRGSMIHIASDAGLRGEQEIGAYSISKAAVVMMSKMLALDGAPSGVRSNCICPGATAPGMRHIGPATKPEAGDDPSCWAPPPLGRIGAVADVASAAVFLACDEASFITGAVLLVDGGAGAGLPMASASSPTTSTPMR